MHRLTPVVRRLRRDATPAEKLLWRAINREQTGFRFRRQVPLGGYVVDFACQEARLVIELDGATHSTDEELAPTPSVRKGSRQRATPSSGSAMRSYSKISTASSKRYG